MKNEEIMGVSPSNLGDKEGPKPPPDEGEIVGISLFDLPKYKLRASIAPGDDEARGTHPPLRPLGFREF
jgi:hypothetical protein